MRLRKRFLYKTTIYFICIYLLSPISGFPKMIGEAKGIDLPIGEIVSRGEVKFETKGNVWKKLESYHFPVFKGGKIKIEKGAGMVTLANHCQIEVGQNSIIYFDQNNQLRIFQGRVHFRIPSENDMTLKVGSLSVTKSRPLQASKSPTLVSQKGEEVIGSLFLHSNSAVTVKSLQGSLFILSQDHTVLAALSSKESVTIPSITTSGKSKWMVAQAGEIEEKEEERERKIADAWDTGRWEYLGLSAEAWIALGYGAAGIIALLFYVDHQMRSKGGEEAAVCP
jgi:hypothetical protein